MSSSRSLAYRPDIDGLRAVAVSSVVAYHAAPAVVRSGYIGVDVFFVISGFLISSIIINERDSGHFSLVGFYLRRIRRLFPALVVVLAATWLLGWYFLLPHEFHALGKHIAAGAGYFINITLKYEAGYFDASADTKPLLHLWSLAVEEQFYIVWPLLLLLIRTHRQLAVVLVCITGVSFCLNLEAVGRNPASAFYLPQNRVWELSAGALLALSTLHAVQWKEWLERWCGRGGISPRLLADVASCIGIALIAGAVFAFDAQVIYPGGWAVIPTLGAVLVIAAGSDGLVNKRVLSHQGLVAIGLISYPLYLWHWPLLSFQSILGLREDWRATALVVTAAVMLACVTYLFVEKPVRRLRATAVPVALFAVTLSFCLVGVLSRTGVLSGRLNSLREHEIGDAISDWRFPKGLQRTRMSSGLTVYANAPAHAGARDKVLYVGDSHIEQYWPRIEQVLTKTQAAKSVVFATMGGCPPVPGVRDDAHPICAGFAERAFDLAMQDDIGTVVIGAAWATYFNNSLSYLEGQGGGRLMVGSPAWNKALQVLQQNVAILVARGKSVWIVWMFPRAASRRWRTVSTGRSRERSAS